MAAGISAFVRLPGQHFPALCCSGLTRAHVKHRKEKGIDVSQFINDLAGRLAKAMAGILFHTQYNGIHPGICGLQGSGKFQRVGRDHTVIGVGSGDERGGIDHPWGDVVQR
jgi:hypothetical protein